MSEEISKESAPVREVQNAPETRSPELDASKLMAEVAPMGDNKLGGGLSTLEQLSKFAPTDLMAGFDKGMAAEAASLAKGHPFNNAMRFMTKSA